MKTQYCTVLRAFMYQGKRLDVGTVVELPALFSAELKSVKKVEYAPEPVKSPDKPQVEPEKPKAPEVKTGQEPEAPKGGKPVYMGKGGSR